MLTKQKEDDSVTAKRCNHLEKLKDKANLTCLMCANSRFNVSSINCEESAELMSSASKSKFYVVILFTISIFLVAGLYIHAVIATNQYINTLILAKKISNERVLFPQIQGFFTVFLICSVIVSGWLCFSKDYSLRVRGWMNVGVLFLTVWLLNFYVIFEQWINKYQ